MIFPPISLLVMTLISYGVRPRKRKDFKRKWLVKRLVRLFHLLLRDFFTPSKLFWNCSQLSFSISPFFFPLLPKSEESVLMCAVWSILDKPSHSFSHSFYRSPSPHPWPPPSFPSSFLPLSVLWMFSEWASSTRRSRLPASIALLAAVGQPQTGLFFQPGM